MSCYRPKISVIIPVYGVEKYIERCARSLFEQTLDDIEYLFIDDCTPDKSIEVLNQVLDEYPHRRSQVIVHRMEQNSGQAAVRKWGMQNATGEYVIHCDSDDWLEKEAYLLMYTKAIEHEADCVICGYSVTDGVNYNIQKDYNLSLNKSELLEKMLKGEVSWALWNKMVSKKIISSPKYKYPNADMGEDMVLSLQACFYCKKITYVNIPLYYYFHNNASITKKRDFISTKKIYLQLLENTDMLISNLKQMGEFSDLSFVRRKYDVKAILHPYVHRKEIYQLWESTYSDLSINYMIKGCIPFAEILRFYLIKIGLYGWIKRILRK